VQDRDQKLLPLQEAVQAATQPFTTEKTEARFAGHVTLGRVKEFSRSDGEALSKIAATMAGQCLGDWLAGEVHLMQSELSPTGARYTPLFAAQLAGQNLTGDHDHESYASITGEEGWANQTQRVTHVSAIGELALALVHVLSQPLESILRQAETAEVLLKAKRRIPPPPGGSIRPLQRARRAADWVSQLRDLLDKPALEARTPVVVNILEEVLKLAKADAAAGGGTPELQVDPALLKEELIEGFQRAFAREAGGQAASNRQRELRQRFSALTARERQVLAQVIRGRLNKQIAADLCLSERTVKHHRTHLTRKLQVGSAVELLRLCKRLISKLAWRRFVQGSHLNANRAAHQAPGG